MNNEKEKNRRQQQHIQYTYTYAICIECQQTIKMWTEAKNDREKVIMEQSTNPFETDGTKYEDPHIIKQSKMIAIAS